MKWFTGPDGERLLTVDDDSAAKYLKKLNIDREILALVRDPNNWSYTDPNDGYQGGGWSPVWNFKEAKKLKDLANITPEMLKESDR